MASPGQRSDDVRRTLNGWKEIAAYLGVDPRSAQRKEKELGLPVRRVQTSKSAKPYAYSDEIDAWRQKQSIPPVQKRQRKLFPQTLTILGSVVVVVVGLSFVWPKRALVDTSYASSVLAQRVLTRAASAKGGLVEIPVTASPGNLVVTPDQQKIFYINTWEADSAVYVLDLSDRSVRAIGLPFKTHRIGLTPDAHHVLVGSTVDGVAILDAKTGKHVRSPIVTGAPVHDFAFSSDSRTAYLAMDQGGIQKLALPTGTLTQLDTQCCPWFLSIDKRTNRLLVSYQNGGPGGRDGHDVVAAFDLKTETLVDRLSGPPLVGGPISNSSERDIALIDGWDACKTAKYDHAGCPEIGRSVFHVVRPSNLQTVLRTVVLEPILGAGPIFSDGRLALLSNESISVLDLSRGNILERFEPLLCGMPVISGKKIFVPRQAPPAILLIESEDQSCSAHPPSLANAFTGDGVVHDVVGVMTGRPSGNIRFVPGLVGQAFEFDGHSALDLSTNSPSVLGARATSMTLYLKIEPNSRGATVAAASEGNRSWRLRIDGAKLASFEYSFGTGTPIRLQSKQVVQTGVWAHLAVVFGLNELSLYVDGVLSDSHAVSDLGLNPFAIRLGGPLETKDEFINAQLDELYFFSEALNAKQVKGLYEVRRTSPCSP